MLHYSYDGRSNKLTQYETVSTATGDQTITTIYQYDSKDRVIKTTTPDGRYTTTEYNSIGKRSATVNADGRQTNYGYDNNGNSILTTYFDGTTTSQTYNTDGTVNTKTDREGRVTSYEYDSWKRQVKTTRPDSTFTRTEYDFDGRVKKQFDAKGNFTEYFYDSQGRKTKTVDAVGNETSYSYNSNGSVDTVENAVGTLTKNVYDYRGRRVSTLWLEPDGAGGFNEIVLDTAVYDVTGRTIGKTDANGNPIAFEYDATGRLVKVIDALSNETTYSYDERGQKLTETDAENHTTVWAYNKFGRKVSRTLPLGQVETFIYNSDGSLASKTDFNGAVTSYSYDATYKRLENISYADGATESFSYEPVSGRKLTATNASGTTSYEYYPVTNRLFKVTNPNGTWISNTWGENGSKLTETTSNATVNWSYDALNRISVAEGLVHTYTPLNKPESVVDIDGNIRNYQYDALGRLLTEEVRNSATTLIARYDYDLDSRGNRTRITELSGKIYEYQYDVLNRLTEEKETMSGVSVVTSYTFDAVGNRLTKTHDGVTTSYSYDANNRLLSDGTHSYSYDNNGNTLSDGTKTFSYDAKNRLVSFIDGIDSGSYTYDTDNLRTAKTVNGVTINYLLCKTCRYAKVIEEIDENGTMLAKYLYGNDLLGSLRNGQMYGFVLDGHGSVRMMTSGSSITDTYDYDAYGVLTDSTGTTENDFRYSGEQFDSNLDQYYLRARYYNQNVGRFHTMDSWKGNNKNPLSLNKYNYTESNPVMNVDPSGRFMILELMMRVTIDYIMSQTAIPMPGENMSAGNFIVIVHEYGEKQDCSDCDPKDYWTWRTTVFKPFGAIISVNANGKSATVTGNSWPDPYYPEKQTNKYPGIAPGSYDAVYRKKGHKGREPGIRLRDGGAVETLAPNPAHDGEKIATGVNIHQSYSSNDNWRYSSNCITIKKSEVSKVWNVLNEEQKGIVILRRY